MTNTPTSTPNGYHTVTSYLNVRGAGQLIDFVKQAFDAQEKQRMARPDGTVGHAEVRLGDSLIMISEASDEYPPMPAMIHLFVADSDASYQRALQAGAVSVMEPADQFYGDRMAGVKDACGNLWWLAAHFEDVSDEEMQRRAAAR